MAIEDFGKKIGGARKDVWSKRGLRIEDIEDFNTAERAKYITKNNIWPKFDYTKMLNEEGYDRDALYFIKAVRDAVPAKPILREYDSVEEIQEKQDAYIEFLTSFKEDLLAIKTKEDIDKLGIGYLEGEGLVTAPTSRWGRYQVEDTAKTFIDNKFFKAMQITPEEAFQEANRKDFLGTELKGVMAKYPIKDVTTNFSVDVYYDSHVMKDANGEYMKDENGSLMYNKVEKVRLKMDRGSGSLSYFYPKNDQLAEFLKAEAYDFGYRFGGNVVIFSPDNRIIGITHDRAEAEQFVERMARAELKLDEAKNEQEKGDEGADKKSTRKKNLVPPQLEHIQRQGPEVRVGNVEGQDFIDTFKIPGGEFGNWLNENDKQTNLNMAFDSLKDIAKALNINDADVSIDGRLSLAFGSRGRKGAVAHYESAREVTNLTKMKGAGSLGHEYFHAMDDIYGKAAHMGGFATEAAMQGYQRNSVWFQLVEAMRYKEVTLTPEEQNARHDTLVLQRCEKLTKELIEMVPDRVLEDPKLIEERNKLIKDLFEKFEDKNYHFMDVKGNGFRNLKSVPGPGINDISKFIDTYSKSYKMNKHNREWLCGKLDGIGMMMRDPRATEVKTEKVETEFYKNAQKLDKNYSKSDHGYWASEKEMAARAFACYLHDKLKEQGIRNDYLTGHAFQSAFINDEQDLVRTYPEKDERQAINQAFDKVIEEMKAKGLFHDREVNQLFIETADKYVAVSKGEQNWECVVMDKDFNVVKEINHVRHDMITIREMAWASAGLESSKDMIELEPAVFEATKAARLEELRIAAQQRALIESLDVPAIDPNSYEQMSFADMLQQAKEESVGNKIEKEKTHQEKQFDVIQATNSENIIENASDIKTFEEIFETAKNTGFSHDDFDELDAAKALRTGMITVYSSKPIEQGGVVYPSYDMAKEMSDGGRVYAEKVNIKDIAWVNGDKGQMAKVPEKDLQKEAPAKDNKGKDER